MEEMDLTDQQLKACKCGYEICVWCWHHIMEMAEKDDTEGRCPACRTSYDKERIVRMTVSTERLAELNSEKKLKSQKTKSKTSEGRKNLSTVRVIQRNLVYIVGIPANLADEETLQRKEFFGQYGKILKVSITRTAGASQHSSNNSCSVYITYSKNEEAIRCIQVVNGYILDGKPLRACFGTTKYCHAWLRNMPCGNPDCLYLHDAGTQEDTFTKDEAISTCASKLQQSPGSAFSNSHQRSGSVLPPPIDNFSSNCNGTLNKSLVKQAVNNPVVYNKNALLNGDTGKSGGLPAAASWGLRVAPNTKLSVSNVTVVQCPDKHKPSLSTSFTPSGNSLSLLNGKLEIFTTSEPCNSKDRLVNPKGLQVGASLEPTNVVKSARCDSPGVSANIDIPRGMIHSCASDSARHVQQASVPNLGMDVGLLSRDEETTPCSLPRLPSVTEDINSSCLNMERSCINYHPHVSGEQLQHVSAHDNLTQRFEALAFEPVPSGFSTSQVPLSDEQSRIGSEVGLKMSSNANFESTSSSKSPEGKERSHQSSSEFVEVIETPDTNCGSQNLISLVKDASQSSSIHAELNADRGEDSIITDILSLDISLDDPLASPHDLAKRLLGDCDNKSGYSKLFNPLKSFGNNESRFSFARMEDSKQQGNHVFSSNTYSLVENKLPQHIEEKNVINLPRSSNATPFCISENSQILDHLQQYSLNDASTSLSRIEVAPPLRTPIQRKAPTIPPPGFYQHLIDRDQHFSVRSPGSNAQYPYLGSSAGLNSAQQITGNNSYADIEFIDPAIMAVSRGKVPLSMTHMVSPNYSSNIIGFSEMDQRLQLLKSRSTNLNHNSMMTVEQSKYNLLQDIGLQEAIGNHNGSWGAWNLAGSSAIESGLLSRRGQSSLAEITNNGRVSYLDSQYGFLRPFPSHEDTKFHASNSGCFYSSAYDM